MRKGDVGVGGEGRRQMGREMCWCKVDGFILVLYHLCFYICRLFVGMVGYGGGGG